MICDARTGIPVPGAAVSVVPSREPDAPPRDNEPPGKRSALSDGSFRIPPRRQWGVYLVPGDIFPLPFTLTVQREGYRRAVIEFLHRAMGDGATTNFGSIRLEREKY